MTPAEASHLAVLQALDHLIGLMLLELFSTPREPYEKAWPCRQQLALARELQDALVDGVKTGTTEALDKLWTTMHPEESEEA